MVNPPNKEIYKKYVDKAFGRHLVYKAYGYYRHNGLNALPLCAERKIIKHAETYNWRDTILKYSFICCPFIWKFMKYKK